MQFVDFIEALVRMATMAYKPHRHNWPPFMSVCALFIYHFADYEIKSSKKKLQPIATVLRRCVEESRFHLPDLDNEDADNTDTEVAGSKKPKETFTRWDDKAQALHHQAAAMNMTFIDDDDD